MIEAYELLIERATPTVALPLDPERCPRCQAEETTFITDDNDGANRIERRQCCVCHRYYAVILQCIHIELTEGPY